MTEISKAVVVGGYTTGNRLLEPLADALCKRFGLDDADPFVFHEVMKDPTDLSKAVKGRAVFGLSAGTFAVAHAGCTGMERISSHNSPERRSAGDLVKGAAMMQGHLLKNTLREALLEGDMEAAWASGRVVVSNLVQFGLHPKVHGRNVPAVSEFSTAGYFSDVRGNLKIPTARIDTDGCEFFGPNELQKWDGERIVLPGGHSQALVTPEAFVAQIPEDVLA